MEDIRTKIEDAIMEAPFMFTLRDKHYTFYPPCLGIKILTSRIVKRLNINMPALQQNTYLELIGTVEQHEDEVCELIAYYTCRTKEEVFNAPVIKGRKNFFLKNADSKSLATLLYLILTSDHTEEFTKYLKLDKEKERQKRVKSVKDNRNSYIFNGKSMYGTLIDHACERYGWTMDYVVWGISYVNLQMLLADSIVDVYLTDDERKKVGISNDSTTIKADSTENKNRIWAIINKEFSD